MLGLEENIIVFENTLDTNYQYSPSINMSKFEKLDFFIYVLDDNNGAITTIDLSMECAGHNDSIGTDWSKLFYESFDTDQNVFVLKEYINRKIITGPTTFAVRCRSQGIFIRIGIKANASGGLYSIGATKKTRS